MQILNMTLNYASKEQLEAGVVNLSGDEQVKMVQLFTFNKIEESFKDERVKRAQELVKICRKHFVNHIMVEGPVFFMPTLVEVMSEHNIDVLFPYKEVVPVDIPLEDGTIKKSTMRKQIGFVLG